MYGDLGRLPQPAGLRDEVAAQVVQDEDGALVAGLRLVEAVEERALLGVGEPGPVPSGTISTVVRDTDMRSAPVYIS